MQTQQSSGASSPSSQQNASHAVVIVGAGAAGIATAASLKQRNASLDIAIIDAAEMHYYQPGWTLVGRGVFEASQTARTMASLIPPGVKWIKASVASFEPDANSVVLDGGGRVKYEQLVVCPGLKLNWAGVEGLVDALGKNGVTSNYRYDLAPYTWKLVQELKGGRALFSQPAMPIKCAGAPQKALYLSCDHWLRTGVLSNIKPEFHLTGAVLFGVADYVPALMEYITKYGVELDFGDTLVAVDGARKMARFSRAKADGSKEVIERDYEFLHAVPPQTAPDFIRSSPLADGAGWVEVDQATLVHKRFPAIFSLGDTCSTPNAKTAAAARKQAPVVAHNLLEVRAGRAASATYDGYGSCPLTVEMGKIVLAEFGYGGKLLPSFPPWVIEGRKPTRAAWILKARVLPRVYWHAMLKGREWMAQPQVSH